MTEPVRPSVSRVALFWTAYVLGTLTLLFSFLLAQVPRPRHGADFTLDYISWAVAGFFLVACLVTAKYSWNFWNPLKQDAPLRPARLLIGAAWVELAFLLYGIIGSLASR
jgi:hypothetical protein